MANHVVDQRSMRFPGVGALSRRDPTPREREAQPSGLTPDETGLAYAQSAIALAVNLSLGLLVAWIVAAANPSWSVIAWSAVLLGVTGVRLLVAVAYRRADEARRTAAVWHRLLVLGAAAAGLTWGSAVPLFLPALAVEQQLVVLMILAGLGVGAIPALASVPLAYVGFALAMILPVAVALAVSDQPELRSLTIAVPVYGAAMLAMARNLRARSRAMVTLVERNRALVRDLTAANEAGHAANEHLLREVERRAATETALVASEERLRDFVETAADWFFELDAQLRVSFASPRYEALLGVPAGGILGREQCALIESAGTRVGGLEAYRDDLLARRPHRRQVSFLPARAVDPVVVELAGKPIRDAAGAFVGFRGTGRDLSESHRLAARLAHQARHDALTALLNRPAFEARLSELLVSPHRLPTTLLYLDLDQFKVVNDTCGHAAGDELLRQVAAVLRARARGGDLVARIGGDEFAVILERCEVNEAVRRAEDLRRAIEDNRFVWGGMGFTVGASIGVVPVDPALGGLTHVMRAADAACYAAKDHGRNRVQVYHPEDEEVLRVHAGMRWVARIEHALDHGRLRLWAQPIVALDGRPESGLHFEVLLRMMDDDGQIVPPGMFLPAAERYGLATRLDRWVVRNVLPMLRRGTDTCDRISCCAVNLSGHSLADEDFLRSIVDACRDPTLASEKLCFEITETAAISNLTHAERFLLALKSYGVRFALDDFGSGLSSFAYLKSLPVDFLKIDGMFVKDMAEDPVDLAMVRAIHDMGAVVGKETIAEFVENDAIRAALEKIGVHYAQGYGIGRPRPIADFLATEADCPASRAVVNG
ncbi:MAG: EAL domain-containing protein [Chromatiales bacterium]|nr:EAL domain-containing protein [Chromatiales bacterium]